MSLQAFTSGKLWGGILTSMGITPGSFINTTNYQINANGERAQISGKIPLSGNITAMGCIVAAVANAPDNGLRMSIQAPDANGLGDGTPIQSGTIASGSVTTGFLSVALGATYVATRGTSIVLVVDIGGAFTAGDDFIVQGINVFAGNTLNYPFGVSATNTTNVLNLPQIYVQYDSGEWVALTELDIGALTSTVDSIDTGTTPDEAGIKFSVPFSCKLSDLIMWITMTAAGSDFDLVLYEGTTPVATISQDGDYKAGGTSLRLFQLPIQTDYTLSINTTYRLIIKPTTTANVNVPYLTIPSALAGMFPGGTSWCYSVRTNAGAFTDYDNGTDGYRKCVALLGFDAFDDGAGSGGGGMRLAGHGGLAA